MTERSPLAIVGMACRFPGGVENPDAFWTLLANGVDAITEVPAERWNAARFHHNNPEAPGRMVTRWGGFVKHADAFDAAFFGISPREAACMDPQHRWLLETGWEALEDAGLPPPMLAGARAGVFVGISHTDYPLLHRRAMPSIDRYTNIGSAMSIAANRLSYLLDLKGPSLAVDTACSSSLVALHLAARSLWSDECEYALVGGVNALLTPEGSIGFSQAHMLSPRGRCRAFDAGADGYVRSEGAAAVIVVPLRLAQTLGLPVRALLLATACNQDGHSAGGITVPSQEAQEAMIREALASAGAAPSDVVYVEAHGTGTPVGDPIETRALAAVLSDGRADGSLLVGSVKTNIGHLEPASGLAGLMKAVLVLQHRQAPPNLHFEEPNPHLPLDRVHIPTTLTPLQLRDGRRPLVGVNSFGFGGSNAHALLAAAPTIEPAPAAEHDGPCVFPLSARSPEALADYAAAYADCIATDRSSAVSLRAFCAAAALQKSHHTWRHAVVAESIDALRAELQSLPVAASPTPHPRVAFIFSGQGPQWWAMGRTLYSREPVVRATWQQCDAVCRRLGGPALLDELLADEAASRLDHTDIAQPALFALQAGLTELWRTWGIEPDAVLGHSVGEAAAAWAAGIFSLEEIFRIILARSRWQETTRNRGRMLAASISAEEAEVWHERFGGRIEVAAHNAPRQVTFAGDADALQAVEAALQEAGTFSRFLPAPYAFHSRQMDPLEGGLRHDLAGLVGRVAKRPMVSTVTGTALHGPEMDADYWWRNVREIVRFADGVAVLLRDGCTAFVEIGPHPVMAAALTETALAAQAPAVCIQSLRRGDDEARTMLQGLASLYRHGSAVRWDALYQRPARPIRLPTYPWQRQHLWHEYPEAARELRSAPPHPLLGERQSHPQPTWFGQFDPRLLGWLDDHCIAGSAVVPAAAYLEMAAAAVRDLTGDETVFLEDIRFHHLLFLPDEQPVPTCVRLDPARWSFQIATARPDTPGQWDVQAEGSYRSGHLHAPERCDLQEIQARCVDERDPDDLYDELSRIGQIYGPNFRRLTSLRLRPDEAVLAAITCPAEQETRGYVLFPPALDACFHSSFALRRSQDTRAVIIMSLQQLRVFRPLTGMVWSHLRLVQHFDNAHVGDLTLFDADGEVVAQLNGLKLLAIEADGRAARRQRRHYQFAWNPQRWLPAPTMEPDADEEVLVFCDRAGLGATLVEALRGRTVRVVPVCRAGDGALDGAFPLADRTGTLCVDTQRDDWAVALWGRLAARDALPTRILYLWDWGEDRDGCATFLALARARIAWPDQGHARWLVVTRNAQPVHVGDAVSPAPAALWGFVRTVQTEQPLWNVALADCSDPALYPRLIEELFAVEPEPEVALRPDGQVVRRLQPVEPKEPPPGPRPPAYALALGQTGFIDSLSFRGQPRRRPGAGEIEVETAAAGLNFRDLMKVLGIYPNPDGEPVCLGDEFAGRVVRIGPGVRRFRTGDRVMGFAPAQGAFASHQIVPISSVWSIPAGLSFAEAASIPVAFGTAYHALHTLARLRAGETVLIHAGAGGVGLAAVQIARKLGAVVLATAGSAEKRAHLRALGVALVMDSRSLAFADECLRFTAGKGVDVVLNSLSGAFQQKSLAVCAPHGRFVEIGKRDLFENSALPLAAFQRSLSFFSFDLGAVLAVDGPAARALRRFLLRGFGDGGFAPLPGPRFPAADAISALRQMQAAGHIGKIVLELDAANPPATPTEFWPRPDGSYLISGGTSGFGLATARWLAERGARHLVLISRRGRVSKADEPQVAAMRDGGATVLVLSADVADPGAVTGVVQRIAETGPPLRGVFHSAMVLRDRFLTDLTDDDLAAVLAPKMSGAWNLHQATRDLPLDCFVMYSSISSIIGAPRHANYAAANAFLDALAHHRVAVGLPALSVNWGQLADVGVAAENHDVGRYLEGIGVLAVPAREALAELPHFIASREPQVAIMDVDWERLARASQKFSTSPVFRDLTESAKASALQDRSVADWRASIADLSSDEQDAAALALVTAQVAATLKMPAESIGPEAPLQGMDSLMAVELKVRIEDRSGCNLPIDALSEGATPARLAERLMLQIRKSRPEPRPRSDTPPRRPEAAAPASIVAPLLRVEPAPLIELVTGGSIEPLTAAALMPWPISLFQETGVAPEAFLDRLNGGRVSLDLILQTPLGPVGVCMLPLTTTQVRPGEPSLLPFVLEGIRQASACGAQCVALTGLIPSATGYGRAIVEACPPAERLAPVTTGHATTVAAVILNLMALLEEAERSLAEETVMIYGVGSIGLSALRLMLDVLPHPAALLLCDPFRDAAYFAELRTSLLREHGYRGDIGIVGTGELGATDPYDASVILGATNREDVLDIERLVPGTLVVDDSSPHCLNATAAFARLAGRRDILFTEGGFIRAGEPMPRIAHVPPSVAGLSVEVPRLFFSMLRAEDITGCILSALLAARRPDLPPTIGLTPHAAARAHWQALAQLGYQAARLNYEGTYLAAEDTARFRQRFRRAAVA